MIDIHAEVAEHLTQFESEVGKVSAEARSIFSQFADRFTNNHQSGVTEVGADASSEVLTQANAAVTALQGQLAVAQGKVSELTAQLADSNLTLSASRASNADLTAQLATANTTIASLQHPAATLGGDSAPAATPAA